MRRGLESTLRLQQCLELMYEVRCSRFEKPGYVTSKQASWETKYLHNRPSVNLSQPQKQSHLN